ncbi:hypothetical protein OE88DRAFT_1595280, partial [Heliocybe sulcata]
LTQIVNSLTVKMEIGAPMASAYLLGNPDHYTSHRFKTIYWKAYVNEVLTDWDLPDIYETISLYDWICLARKTRITSKTSTSSQADAKLNDPHDQLGTISIEGQDRQKEHVGYNFTIHHPQHNTHNVIMVKEMRALVPNFIGGNLPRKDSGNREFYCTTMLTLFKHWRKGKDLKEEEESWDDAYLKYNFTLRQQELMNFFNIRYECYDARDDYSKQRK